MKSPNTRMNPNHDLILKGSKWYLHLYIPVKLRKPRAPKYLVKNLETDSIIRAREIRNSIQRELFSPEKPIVLTEYEQLISLECKQFIAGNPHIEPEEAEYLYRSLVIESIVPDESVALCTLSVNDQHKLTVLADRQSSVCYLRDQLIDRKIKLGMSASVRTKIHRAVQWLLGDLVDIDIAQVTWKMVDQRLATVESHSTGYKRGLLCYIGEIWTLAGNLGCTVATVNPAKNHPLKSDKHSYDTLTMDEIRTLYSAATDHRVRLLIHIVATSGMRLSEAVRAKISIVDGIPCWQINHGKNANAVRVIPVHSSIDLELYHDGWSQVGERFLSTKFTRLVHSILPDQGHRKLNVHSFRHTLVNYLSSMGHGDYLISRITGHGKSSVQGAMATYQQGKVDVQILQPLIELIPDITKPIAKPA